MLLLTRHLSFDSSQKHYVAPAHDLRSWSPPDSPSSFPISYGGVNALLKKTSGPGTERVMERVYHVAAHRSMWYVPVGRLSCTLILTFIRRRPDIGHSASPADTLSTLLLPGYAACLLSGDTLPGWAGRWYTVRATDEDERFLQNRILRITPPSHCS